MGNLVAKKKPRPGDITETDRAVLTLKTQRRKLEEQSHLLEKRIGHHAEVARDLVRLQKRDRALLALKKKRISEQQLEGLIKWLANVEEMLAGMELTQQQARVFSALKQGNEALKKIQADVSVDDVQQLMDDTAEAKAYQDAIAEALGEALSSEDDMAVLAELEAMEELEEENQAAEIKAQMETLPSPPTAEVEPAAGVPVPDQEAGEQTAEAANEEAEEAEEAEEVEAARQRQLEPALLAA